LLSRLGLAHEGIYGDAITVHITGAVDIALLKQAG
jgi:hypothetical protein